MRTTATLFVSCVSNELGTYRSALLEDLEFPNVRVEIQEKFKKSPTGDPILIKLDDYIRECDAVVHLVGNEAGSKASEANRNLLLARHSNLPEQLGLDLETIENLTYTQWEAWLAVFYDKKLIIAVRRPRALCDRPLLTAEAESGSKHQEEHLERLATLHSRHPEIEFENCNELVILLLKFLLHLLPPAFSEKHRVGSVRLERFGEGMVNKLKSRLKKLDSQWPGIELFAVAAYVQITGQLPDLIDPDRDQLAAIVDDLAERTCELDLLALVQRIVWGAEALGASATDLESWLSEVLVCCRSDQEALAGHMLDSEKGWPRNCHRPPLPRIEIGWQPALSDGALVDRMAFIRWGRCRGMIDLSHHRQGRLDNAVDDVVDSLYEHRVRSMWPYERIEVFVDKDRLNFPWEFRGTAPAAEHLHEWPTVLRLNRKPFQRRGLRPAPATVRRNEIACCIGEAEDFSPSLSQAGTFFAAWALCSHAPGSLLDKVTDLMGVGLWSRLPCLEADFTELVGELDEIPMPQLPLWLHQRRGCTPPNLWRGVALLYDDRDLPAFEFPSERRNAEHQRRTALRL